MNKRFEENKKAGKFKMVTRWAVYDVVEGQKWLQAIYPTELEANGCRKTLARIRGLEAIRVEKIQVKNYNV